MRIEPARTPAFLLTGFLGSGKTTLLNAALRVPAMANTAVVVNELGDIGLDNLIIAQATDNVVLLDAGCLCCANTGALHETLADLAGRRARGEIPAFERVIIETSGAVDPAPLLNVLLGHPLVTGQYALEATVCVVDAQHFLASRAQYPELDKQAAVAERIVISKRDLADPAPVIAFLKELNPEAEFVDSVSDVVSVHSGYRKPFAPQRFREWPDADHGNRLVCVARDLQEAEIEVTLPALNAVPGTHAMYSLKDLQERQAQQ